MLASARMAAEKAPWLTSDLVVVPDFPFSNRLSGLIMKEEAGKRLVRLNATLAMIQFCGSELRNVTSYFSSTLIGALQPVSMLFILLYILGGIYLSSIPDTHSRV